MLIDHRTYRILPGRVPAQLDLYSKLAYPVQLRYMGEPHYYLVSESGQLNTLVHGWIYESAADREAKRAKMAQDPDWKHFLSENAKAQPDQRPHNQYGHPRDPAHEPLPRQEGYTHPYTGPFGSVMTIS